MNKDIHFYWGGGKLSYLQHLTVVSFLYHNPDWAAHLHMPKKQNLIYPTWNTGEQSIEYTGKDWLKETKKLCKVHEIDFNELGINHLHDVYKSDVIRWKILYEYGGIWSDLDIFYIAPVGEIATPSLIPEENYDSAVVFDGVHYIIGFFITKPKQQLFKDIYDEALKLATGNLEDYQSLGSRMIKNMYPDISDMRRKHKEANIENLYMSVIYPYIDFYLAEIFEDTDRTENDTIGIHWFNGSPIAKRYQNEFDTRKDDNSFISKKVRELCSQL